MSQFRVSVVIPVYNAEKYVERAIKSALSQKEVAEVIIIDDGYSDGAYDICKKIAAKDNRVKLLQHPQNANKGAAESRNLGILHSQSEYIAFLDADDYYLPNRFKLTDETFRSADNIDAVYEPVGFEVIGDDAFNKLTKIKRRITKENISHYLSYPIKVYNGHDLFRAFLVGGNDGPCTDGITVKKALFAKAGMFNTMLKLHEDTELWIRLSYFGNFHSTVNHVEPVSIRTMHDENRTYYPTAQTTATLWQAILGWASQANMAKDEFNHILTRYKQLVN